MPREILKKYCESLSIDHTVNSQSKNVTLFAEKYSSMIQVMSTSLYEISVVFITVKPVHAFTSFTD